MTDKLDAATIRELLAQMENDDSLDPRKFLELARYALELSDKVYVPKITDDDEVITYREQAERLLKERERVGVCPTCGHGLENHGCKLCECKCEFPPAGEKCVKCGHIKANEFYDEDTRCQIHNGDGVICGCNCEFAPAGELVSREAAMRALAEPYEVGNNEFQDIALKRIRALGR